jgi:hypothetical protein
MDGAPHASGNDAIGAVLKVDEMIDAANTQRWIIGGLAAAGSPQPRSSIRRPGAVTG